ncbi:MAG TPA: CBS domain-containing protein [Polyangiaceae bacterium]
MKTDTVVIPPNASVAEAARKMNDNGVGALLVVEDGKLIGVFSERDLLCRVVALGKEPELVHVGDVATQNVVSLSPDMHARDCLAAFKQQRVRHLPVVENGRPVGVVGLRDLLTYMSDAIERILDSEAYRLALDAGPDPYDHVGGSYAR